MGDTHFFRELKDYGKKIAVFKQRRYIQELSNAADNSQTLSTLYEQVSSGICVAISMDWLATCFSTGIAKYQTGDHDHNRGITAQMAPVQQYFMIDLKEQLPSVSQRMAAMAEANGLTLRKEQVPLPGADRQAIAALVQALQGSFLARHFLLVMQMDVGQKRPSHAVAIERIIGGIRFFDPGIGEYRVHESDYEKFFECYFRLKMAHWRGTNLILSIYEVDERGRRA